MRLRRLVQLTAGERPTLIFDGDCALCAACVAWARRWVRPAVTFMPWQGADVGTWGVTEVQCRAAVQWVSRSASGDLTIRSGGQAICQTLMRGVAPWPVLGALGSLPGLRYLVDVAYRTVARHRSRIPLPRRARSARAPGGCAVSLPEPSGR